jgi:alginate O-acetyltransferase complex protein AlgI
MNFATGAFAFFFLPAALMIFHCTRRMAGFRASFFVLILLSAVFYASWRWQYLALILGTIVVNYVIGIMIQTSPGDARRKLIITGAVSANLAVLAYFKYLDFLIANFALATGLNLHTLGIVLPLGISFFVFQQISYLVDCYRGDAGTRNFLDYALFVLFFPHMIAGPIVRAAILLPQFHRPLPESVTRLLGVGLAIFVLGAAKKLCLANPLADIADPVFAAAKAGQPLSAASAISGTLAYSFQIYFDFSGYTDMAIGIAAMFGIRLPINFDSPYRARGIIEFWRRWHISLSEWLRDYLYIPLGGSRKGVPRQYASLLITMLLGGLWHGAGWGFVIWGAIHGAALATEHAIRRGSTKRPWLIAIPTFVFVTMAWVFFRAETLSAAMAIFHAMTDLDSISWPDLSFDTMSWPDLAVIDWPGLADEMARFDWPGFAVEMARSGWRSWELLGFAGVIVWLMPNTNQIFSGTWPAFEMRSARVLEVLQARAPRWIAFRPNVAWGIMIAVIAYVAMRSSYLATPVPFIYFQF